MEHAMANNTLDLCRRELQEAEKAEHLDAALADNEIAFWEQGQAVGNAGLSMSVPSPSMSWDDDSVEWPSLSWVGGDLSTSAPSRFTRWGDW